MQEITRLSESIDRIKSCDDLQSLNTYIGCLRDYYDLANIEYIDTTLDSSNSKNKIRFVTYKKEWIKIYTERNYLQIDPVIRLASKSYLPLDWSSIERDTAEVRRFFTEADRYSVGRQGLTIPLRGPGGDKALFTITSHVDDREWRVRKLDYMREFQLLAYYVHHQVCRLSSGNISLTQPALSRREKECLGLMTRGLMPKQIAGKLGISETAVRTYVRSARFKLGCSSPIQAVAKAVSLELIDT